MFLPRTKDYFIEISSDHSDEVAPVPCYALVNEDTGITEMYDIMLPRMHQSMHDLQDKHDAMMDVENAVSLTVVDKTEH